MSASENQSRPAASPRWHGLLAWLAAFICCALALTSQSLWIDESYTALKAQQTSLAGWWHELLRAGGSDVQMPLYMIWIWVCEKIVGSSEIALRAANLFWIFPGFLALWFSLARRPQLRLAVFLVAVCNPFIWYYLNEARPYAMQIGASLVLAAALCRWSEKPFSPASGEALWVWGFILALLALSGASMLGMIWAGAAILAALFLSPKERLLKLGRNYLFVWLAGLALLAVLGFYYLWTLKAGARASDAATTDWKNVAFIGYELLGFAGLGPGRLELRDGGLQVFKAHAPLLGWFAARVLGLIIFAARDLLQNYPRQKILGLAVVVAAPALFILGAGFAMHFRVLGRHFAPLLPVVVLLMGLGVTAAWRQGSTGKILVVGFFALCLASGLSLRLAARHGKDDYRSAAGLARSALAQGKCVWWSADAGAASYYQLPVTTNSAVAGSALLLNNPPEELLPALVPADVVIVSRKDLYDPHSVIAGFVERNHFNQSAVLPAFVVWEKPAAKTNR